ncbi:MAG: hypothetical protein JHC80_06400, partial [Polynucleobacter sp.]|nr:hypothetical protein [Polynucleobacter sp.]
MADAIPTPAGGNTEAASQIDNLAMENAPSGNEQGEARADAAADSGNNPEQEGPSLFNQTTTPNNNDPTLTAGPNESPLENGTVQNPTGELGGAGDIDTGNGQQVAPTVTAQGGEEGGPPGFAVLGQGIPPANGEQQGANPIGANNAAPAATPPTATPPGITPINPNPNDPDAPPPPDGTGDPGDNPPGPVTGTPELLITKTAVVTDHGYAPDSESDDGSDFGPNLSSTSPTSVDSAGDEINYTLTASNQGDVTITNIKIYDSMFAKLVEQGTTSVSVV